VDWLNVIVLRFLGTFAVKFDVSTATVDEKIKALETSGAHSGDLAACCTFRTTRRTGHDTRVPHLAQVLDPANERPNSKETKSCRAGVRDTRGPARGSASQAP